MVSQAEHLWSQTLPRTSGAKLFRAPVIRAPVTAPDSETVSHTEAASGAHGR